MNDSFEKKKRTAERATFGSERVLEDAFMTEVQDRILESFSDALEDSGFTAEETEQFRAQLSQLSLSDVQGVLSMPHELRERRFPKFLARVHAGESITTIVQDLVREARERGFTIGYHMSNSDILPRKGKESTAWVIDGKEQDHRDNDLPMAYYSTSLQSLYGSKRARFLYIVRADTGRETTHKQDNDGTWGRATKLDIVDKLDYESVISKARDRANGLVDA